MIKMTEPKEIKVYQIETVLQESETFKEDILKVWPAKYEYIISFMDVESSMEKNVYETYVKVNKLFISEQFDGLTRQMLCGDMIVVDDHHFVLGKEEFIYLGKPGKSDNE